MIAALLLLLLAAGSPGQAPDPVARGREAWQAGRVEEALALFERAAVEERTDAWLWYAMGRCAERLGRDADAVLHHRRALRHRPGDARATAALQRVRRRLGLVGEEPTSAVARLARRLDEVPPGLVVLLAAVLQMAGLLGWILCGGAPVGRGVTVLVTVLGVACAVWSVSLRLVPAPPGAVARRGDVAVRTGPHPAAAVTTVLPAGAAVDVLGRSDRWVHVRLPHGDGWVRRPSVGLVD